MKPLLFPILLLLLPVFACKQPHKTDNIKIVGHPDFAIYHQYISNESVCKYIFNDMIECSVVVNDSGPYHCFIKENVLGQKQIYYFCIDDVLKFNYIPEYDSLNYDLSLNYFDTERDKIKWSSKFERIPQLRQNSEEYHKRIETLDDAKDLSDFYNNSLYFQCDDSIIDFETKETVLNKLIEITQVQLVGKYLRSVPNYDNAIVIGYRYVCHSYGILYWSRYHYAKLKDYIVDLNKNLSNRIFFRYRNDDRPKESWKEEHRYFFSKYLQSIQKQNLKYISKQFEVTDSLYYQYDFCYSVDYRYSDTRFFFFKIDWEGDKITIHKNYINKEFLPTTRISNYYLYY